MRRSRSLIVSVVATMAAGALLAGCSQSSSDQSAAADSSSDQPAAADSSSDQTAAPDSANAGAPEWCGTKPLNISYADGFSGNTWRQVTRAIYEQTAAECPNIESAGYTDANQDTQTAISQINSSVAQGVDGLLIFPDAGAALLPAVKSAASQGVVVGTNLSQIPGATTESVPESVLQDNAGLGKTYAEWMVKVLNGKGNVVYLGGTPGNTDSPAQTKAILEVFAQHPDMNLVTGDWVVANWSQADSQKALAGLLGTNEIDGVIGDVDGAFIGAVQALQAAGKPMIPIAAAESNAASCTWEEASGGDPQAFPAMFTSVANVSARLLTEAVVARAAGAPMPSEIDPSGVTLFQRPVYYDTTDGNDPVCDQSLPQAASVSTGLSPDQLKALFSN